MTVSQLIEKLDLPKEYFTIYISKGSYIPASSPNALEIVVEHYEVFLSKTVCSTRRIKKCDKEWHKVVSINKPNVNLEKFSLDENGVLARDTTQQN